MLEKLVRRWLHSDNREHMEWSLPERDILLCDSLCLYNSRFYLGKI